MFEIGLDVPTGRGNACVVPYASLSSVRSSSTRACFRAITSAIANHSVVTTHTMMEVPHRIIENNEINITHLCFLVPLPDNLHLPDLDPVSAYVGNRTKIR